MFIEMHMIQSFAPANLNRDDTNNPKDCEFGGVRRGRISSQCLKRAMRTAPAFAEVTDADIGTRTRWLARLLQERLVALHKPSEEAEAISLAFVAEYAGKLDKDGKRSAVLLYLSDSEVADFVQALADGWEGLVNEETRSDMIKKMVKSLVKAHKSTTSAPDIALFGRMLADKPEVNLEAACQVAHAISTHRITMEMDFFTAVDDLLKEEEAGAGMMGFTGFDSACFYRYARIDWEQLLTNLDGDLELALRTIEGFFRAAVSAVPSGKQNSFAAYNPPSLLLAVVRSDGMGWSLVNAFEKPVRANREGGLVTPSADALDSYWGRLCKVYGTDTLKCIAALSLDAELPLPNLKGSLCETQDEWIAAVLGVLSSQEAV